MAPARGQPLNSSFKIEPGDIQLASPTSSAGMRMTGSPSPCAPLPFPVTPDIDALEKGPTATLFAPTTLVNDFWLVFGDHEDDLDKPTADDPRPLRVQLTAIGQAKGLNVRFLSIEAFMALKPGDAPQSLAIGLLAHGTETAAGHKMAGRTGHLYLTTQLMEQGRALSAVAQSVWSCKVGIAADDVAASPALMREPGALYDLRGGRQVSSTNQDVAEIRDMVAYYADCKEQGVCPANVEIYLQSQLRSANCLRLVSPPSTGTAGPGTIGHFPGPKGRALLDGMSIRDRLQPASADDAAIARFNFSSPVMPRTQAGTEYVLRQRIFRGDAASVRILVRQPGMDINAHIVCESIPLHLAVGFRQVAVMEELFKVPGVDINVRNQQGHTPLSIACHLGYAEVVRTLVKATDADGKRMNVDVNAPNAAGYAPLYLAAFAGHASVVAELLQVPEIVANARLRFAQTALLAACRRGHAEVVQELLKSNEISGAVEDIVLPAMLEACKHGHLNVAAAIIYAPGLEGHSNYLIQELVKFRQGAGALGGQAVGPTAGKST